MSASVVLYGSDKRLVLSIGEAIRQPVYMAYTEVTGATADATTDFITKSAHGLSNGHELLIRTSSGVVPTGLTAGTHYFVRDVTANTFKLSATNGGAAIDITANGTTGWTYTRQTWNTIRIGLRGAFNATGNVTGTPTWAVSLCKGTTNGYGAATPDFVAGVRNIGATLTYNAGPTAYLASTASNEFSHFTKIAGVLTTSTFGVAQIFFSSDTSIRSGLFFEFQKGTTPTTWKYSVSGPGSSASAQSDLTDAEFEAIMGLANIQAASISAVKSGYANFANAATWQTINESTAGILDNISIYWDRSTPTYGFDVKHALIA